MSDDYLDFTQYVNKSIDLAACLRLFPGTVIDDGDLWDCGPADARHPPLVHAPSSPRATDARVPGHVPDHRRERQPLQHPAERPPLHGGDVQPGRRPVQRQRLHAGERRRVQEVRLLPDGRPDVQPQLRGDRGRPQVLRQPLEHLGRQGRQRELPHQRRRHRAPGARESARAEAHRLLHERRVPGRRPRSSPRPRSSRPTGATRSRARSARWWPRRGCRTGHHRRPDHAGGGEGAHGRRWQPTWSSSSRTLQPDERQGVPRGPDEPTADLVPTVTQAVDVSVDALDLAHLRRPAPSWRRRRSRCPRPIRRSSPGSATATCATRSSTGWTAPSRRCRSATARPPPTRRRARSSPPRSTTTAPRWTPTRSSPPTPSSSSTIRSRSTTCSRARRSRTCSRRRTTRRRRALR